MYYCLVGWWKTSLIWNTPLLAQVEKVEVDSILKIVPIICLMRELLKSGFLKISAIYFSGFFYKPILIKIHEKKTILYRGEEPQGEVRLVEI